MTAPVETRTSSSTTVLGQWGSTRCFVRDGTVIRVTPHVRNSTVDRLVLVNTCGETEVVKSLLEGAKKKYVGKPYQKWVRRDG